MAISVDFIEYISECITDTGIVTYKKIPAILETDRLILREMTQDDLLALCKILQDKDVMYAYEHAFSDEETQLWLDRQLERYENYGFGLWAVILKETNEMIGQCGLTMQSVGECEVLEVGYLFQKDFWHNGYATEAAIACKNYAFEKLNKNEVYSIIRDNNIASQNVAKRNGMTICGEIVKHYYNMEMPHLLYCVKKEVA
ncbi:MAG: GNAT family N-acetyltransferase [Oscillospiraceae bacterium]